MFYAVKVGKVPGIYRTWAECSENVTGFKGAQFHKFKSEDEAKLWLHEGNDALKSYVNGQKIQYPCAFVDGSYNPEKDIVGFGTVIKESDKEFKEDGSEPYTVEIKGIGDNLSLKTMRNVYGEILASIAAIKEARNIEFKSINIYYDYSGVEKWATGEWRTKSDFIKEYVKFVKENQKEMEINFFKVEAHSGVHLNELADSLAKSAAF